MSLKSTLAAAQAAALLGFWTGGSLAQTAAAPEAAEDADAAVPEPSPRSAAARRTLRLGIDDVRVESGAFDGTPALSSQTSASVSAFALWSPDRQWEVRLGARIDGVRQAGGTAAYSETAGDLSDTYVRWRSGPTRLTAGMQTVVWGRVDELPPADRVSRVDLSRFILDDLTDRRRAVPALRWEQTLGDYKLDTVVLPHFRPAVLPDLRNAWSPIDPSRGRVLGIEPDPALAAFVSSAAVVRRNTDSGGVGLRLTRTGVAPVDLGVTVAHTRQTLPYFEPDFAGSRLIESYPFQTFAGVDAEMVAADVTWRSELGYTDDVPVTRVSGGTESATSWDWIGAAEFFPGGRDLRVNLQLVVRELHTRAPVLERTRYVGINGEIEALLAQGRWKIGMRFASGLNAHDVYLAPKISFTGWEPHELYIVGRYFDGDARSLGGFHRDHGMVAAGLKTRF